MSLELDKSCWKRVAFGEVIRHVTDRVDPLQSGLKRFVAGEHISRANLEIRSWGEIGKDPMGPMFYKRFGPEHTLYVSRRSYLRKTAVPGFPGICGEKTFVLETIDPDVLSQGFIPFLMSSDAFHNYAISMSRGSVNPYVNWTDLAAYQFDLPPMEDQLRISELLWSLESHRRKISEEVNATTAARDIFLVDVVHNLGIESTLGEVADVAPKEPPLEAEAPFIEMADVPEWGTWASSSGAKGTRGGVRARGGDTLVARITPCLENGKIARVPLDLDRVGGSTEFIVLRAKPGLDPHFLFLWASSRPVHAAAIAMMSGTTGRQRVAAKDLSVLKFRLPTQAEQQSVIDQVEVFSRGRAAAMAEIDSLQVLYRALAKEVFGGEE